MSNPHFLQKLAISSIVGALSTVSFGVASQSAEAAAIAGQFTPVAVYSNWVGAFGLAYDSQNNLMWYTQGDSGDTLIRSFTPYKDLDPNIFPIVKGVREIDIAGGNHGANTTSPTDGAYFKSLAFDGTTSQLVMQGSGVNLQSFDPITANNENLNYRPGSATSSFSDGLDVDGANTWYSPDVQDIYNNGVLVVDDNNPAQTTLPQWTGLGSNVSAGWSGVEQVGDSLFAVAVQSFSDTGRSRTIVRYDLTGNLLGFDPDGDPVAARWEDLAYDGQFLYAADLRGDHNDDGIFGDVYVFAVEGGLNPNPNPNPPATPEPSTIFGLLAIGGLGLGLKRKKEQV